MLDFLYYLINIELGLTFVLLLIGTLIIRSQLNGNILESRVLENTINYIENMDNDERDRLYYKLDNYSKTFPFYIDLVKQYMLSWFFLSNLSIASYLYINDYGYTPLVLLGLYILMRVIFSNLIIEILVIIYQRPHGE